MSSHRTLRTRPSLLRTILREQRGRVLAGSALWIGHQLGEMAVPVVVGVIVDRAIATGDEAALLRWILVLVVVFAAFSNSYRFGARINERAQLEAMHRLVMEVTGRVLHPAGGADTTMRPGALVATAASDAEGASQVVFAVAGGAAGIAALLAASAALLLISVPLGLMVLVGLPLVVLAMQALVRPLERRVAEQREQATAAAGIAADLVSGLRILKGLGVERRAAARYQQMSRRSLDAGLKAANVEAVHDGAAVATTGIVIAAVVLVGGRLAIDDTISIGALVAAVGLAQFLVGPLLRIGYFGAVLGHARASAARVALVLASEPAVRQAGGHFDHEVRGALDVRDLHGPVLRGLDLRIDPGELVALAVTDPATAAELLAVLGRMVEPESGAVLVDQLDLRDLDLEIARAAVLVSHHDGELFSGTIRANVASAGEPGRDLTPALAAADADEVADSQPDGLDTIVTERGRSLSGGQKQRIVLARALAADPPVLVLHDPTTAVDAATEAQIAGALPRVRAGRTTLVLTTSPALLAVADRVLLVEHGRVVAEGRHDELTADARYREAVLR